MINKIPFRFLNTILLLFGLWSCQTYLKKTNDIRALNSTNDFAESNLNGKHYIITIHGFNGAVNTFGNLEKILMDHLNQIDSNPNYQFLNFIYPTGQYKNIFELSYKYLSEFLNAKIPDLKKEDKITFITHSQGGLILTVWKFAAQFGLVKNNYQFFNVKNDKNFADQTNQVIHLGVPFWGINAAQKFHDTIFFDPGFDNEFLQMKFNSELIEWFRYLAKTKRNDPTNYLEIAGVLPNNKNEYFYGENFETSKGNKIFDKIKVGIYEALMKRYSFSSEKPGRKKPGRFESDQIVMLPRAKPYFFAAHKKVKCEDQVIESKEFNTESLFLKNKFIVTQGLHSGSFAKSAKSLVDVPFYCQDPNLCDHPSYHYILESIANCENKNCENSARKNIIDVLKVKNRKQIMYDQVLTSAIDLQGFAIDLNLRLPTNYEFPEDYFKTSNQFDENETLQNRNLRSKIVLSKSIKIDESLLENDLKDLFDIKLQRKRHITAASVTQKKVNSLSDSNIINSNVAHFSIIGLVKLKKLQNLNSEKMNKLAERIQNGLVLPLIVSIPENISYYKRELKVQAVVKPGQLTFLDLDFEGMIDCTQ